MNRYPSFWRSFMIGFAWTVIIGLIVLMFVRYAYSAQINTGPWLQAVTETSAVVMWESDTKQPGLVKIGTRQWESQFTVVLPASADDTTAIIHTARLSGLEPGRTYQYHVDMGNVSSELLSFTTPMKKDKWRFAFTSNPNALSPGKAQTAWKNISAAKPDFVVISGDISNKSTNNDYRQFMRRGYPLVATVPVYTVPGNHDNRSNSRYTDWFHNAGDGSLSERFHTFSVCRMRFVGIDDSHPRVSGLNVSWFADALKRKNTQWHLAIMNGNYRKYADMKAYLDANMRNIDVLLTSGSGAQYTDGDTLRVEAGGSNYVYHIVEMTDSKITATQYNSDGVAKGTAQITRQVTDAGTKPKPPTGLKVEEE